MIWAELPPTATREATHSTWAYTALPYTDAGGNALWSVTVVEFRGKVKCRRVVDRYTLEPTPPEVGPAGVAFHVHKTHHSGDEDTARGRQSAARVGEVYRCEVGPGYRRCTCTGGATEGHRPGGACLHALVLTDLTDRGDLRPAHPPRGRSR